MIISNENFFTLCPPLPPTQNSLLLTQAVCSVTLLNWRLFWDLKWAGGNVEIMPVSDLDLELCTRYFHIKPNLQKKLAHDIFLSFSALQAPSWFCHWIKETVLLKVVAGICVAYWYFSFFPFCYLAGIGEAFTSPPLLYVTVTYKHTETHMSIHLLWATIPWRSWTNCVELLAEAEEMYSHEVGGARTLHLPALTVPRFSTSQHLRGKDSQTGKVGEGGRAWRKTWRVHLALETLSEWQRGVRLLFGEWRQLRSPLIAITLIWWVGHIESVPV